MADRIGQQLGSYRLTRLLGCGGFAEVYLVEHVRLHCQAAVKVLSAQMGEEEDPQFEAEVRTIARLSHPHIIRVFDLAVQAGTHQGEFMRVPPTGTSIRVGAVDIARFEGGKIVEQWGQTDLSRLMQQIGAIPPPGYGGAWLFSTRACADPLARKQGEEAPLTLLELLLTRALC